MAEKPAILLVPGAWHSPDVYDRVITHLSAAGYTTSKVHLPSVGALPGLPNFDPDVQQIRSQLTTLIDAGKEVVLVVHSYGGVPSSQAVEGLDLATRRAQGKRGGVAHLVYCCSFMIREGWSLATAFGNRDVPWYRVSDDGLNVSPADPIEHFYNDMPRAEAEEAVTKLRTHSYQCLSSSVLSFAGWKVVPATYLYCTEDKAIPYPVQKMMVEEFAKGVDVRTETLEAGHSPFFSKPKETADAIRRAAGENV